MKLDLEQLRELIRLLDESNLTEIEVEHDDDRIRVRRDPAPVSGAVTSAEAASTTQSGGAPAVEDDGNYVTSPFVGTFYRAASPESEEFVREGDSGPMGSSAKDGLARITISTVIKIRKGPCEMVMN